jgi:hypothetical protein
MMADDKQKNFILVRDASRLQARVFQPGSSRCGTTCPELLVSRGLDTVAFPGVTACKLFGRRLYERSGVLQRCAACEELP